MMAALAVFASVMALVVGSALLGISVKYFLHDDDAKSAAIMNVY
jgi:hypothetical protein